MRRLCSSNMGSREVVQRLLSMHAPFSQAAAMLDNPATGL